MPSRSLNKPTTKFDGFLRKIWAHIHRFNQSKKLNAITAFCEKAGKLVIVITAIKWLIEAPDRRQQIIASAWSSVSLAAMNHADGGRAESLNKLNEYGVLFDGLGFKDTFIDSLHLDGAWVTHAKFDNVILRRSSFNCIRKKFWSLEKTCTSFRESKFINPKIYASSFNGADFSDSKFIDHFSNAEPENYNGSNISTRVSNFENAGFLMATFRDISFANDDFSGANFMNAAFYKVEFIHSKFKKGSEEIKKANFEGALFVDVSFLEADISVEDLKLASLCRVVINGKTYTNDGCRYEKIVLDRTKISAWQ